jgi:hypothetical protein
MKIVEEKDHMM